jgi:hypothetical protein
MPSRTAQWFTVSLALVMLGFILACGGIGFAYEKELPGKYCLQATDTLEQLCIAKMPTDGGNVYHHVIGKIVYEAGWNDNFIIAKQHPEGNEKFTSIFIIRVSDGKMTESRSEADFADQRATLGVPKELTFTWSLDGVKNEAK